jgi:hypothetical protein
MTSIDLIDVSTPVCHPQGVFQIKEIQAQHANLGMVSQHLV